MAAKLLNTTHAGVWIDHRVAQVVALSSEGHTTTSIVSNVEKHREAHGSQEVPADDRRQRALTGELNIYYDAVADALHTYGAILIFGPGEAKGELRTRLLHRYPAAHVSDVETADKMTDNQIVAKVRAHFGS
jgi:hypothetical protein